MSFSRTKRRSHAVRMNSKRWCKDADVSIITEPECLQTNVRLQKLSVIDKIDTSNSGSYIIVNFHELTKLFVNLKCSHCDEQTLKLELGNKLGFSYNLNLTCSSCAKKLCAVQTSNDRKGNTVPDINLRITHAFFHIGKGYSAVEKFCMIMNILPFSSRTFSNCTKLLHSANAVASSNILKDVHYEVKCAYRKDSLIPLDVTDIGVSFDGSWLTRGFSSLIGIGCVIDILTGYVIDYEIMSKVCRHCEVAKSDFGESSAEYSIWYDGHKSVCDINHAGSSASMEMEAALMLWRRSTLLGFQYSTLLSDGDCKTFNYLREKKVYGDNIEIKKEECINHVSKRLGTALRLVVKESRARGITLGGKGHGSLKETTIKKLTSYYQKAIIRNKGNPAAMKNDIYATLYHSISSDLKPQHSKCPTGEDSWCFYNSAVAKGDSPGSHKLHVGTPLKESTLPFILPIYQRLASDELLERCINCGTQNANECLHSMIWAKCPKETFVYKQRVKHAVMEAICEYNKGTSRSIREIQKALGVGIGKYSTTLGVILDSRKKLFRNRRKNVKYQLARKLVKKAILNRNIATKKKEGVTYGAGCF